MSLGRSALLLAVLSAVGFSNPVLAFAQVATLGESDFDGNAAKSDADAEAAQSYSDVDTNAAARRFEAGANDESDSDVDPAQSHSDAGDDAAAAEPTSEAGVDATETVSDADVAAEEAGVDATETDADADAAAEEPDSDADAEASVPSPPSSAASAADELAPVPAPPAAYGERAPAAPGHTPSDADALSVDAADERHAQPTTRGERSVPPDEADALSVDAADERHAQPTTRGERPVPLALPSPRARPVPLDLASGHAPRAPLWRPRARVSLRGAALGNLLGAGAVVAGLASTRLWFGNPTSAFQGTLEAEVGPLWAAPREGIGQSTFSLRLGFELGYENRLGVELYARRMGRAYGPDEVGSHHLIGLAISFQFERGGGLQTQLGVGPTSHLGFRFVAPLTPRVAIVFDTEVLLGFVAMGINASRTELGARVQLTSPESPKLKVALDVGASRGRVSFFPRCELVSCPEELRTAAGFGGFVGLVIERARRSQ